MIHRWLRNWEANIIQMQTHLTFEELIKVLCDKINRRTGYTKSRLENLLEKSICYSVTTDSGKLLQMAVTGRLYLQ